MLKQIIKQIIPSNTWRMLYEWRRGLIPYPSWSSAAAAAGSYDNDMLNRFRIARRQTHVAPMAPSHHLATTIASLPSTDGISVVDFGGATGELMLALRGLMPTVRCIVVEHEKLVEMMPQIEGVSFRTDIPSQCDVFFSGGTLQYLADPYAVLVLAFKAARQAVVLDRNSFSPKTIYRVQRGRLHTNGEGPIPSGFPNKRISYPHQTIREDMVIKIAQEAGFNLVYSKGEDRGVVPYRDQVYGKILVFKKGS